LLSECFYQSPSTKRVAAALATASALVYLAGIVGFTRAIDTGDFVFDTVLTVLGAVGFIWATFRMTKLGVVVTAKGIALRGWLRNDFINWDRIESFQSGSDIAVGDLTIRELLAIPALQSYVVLKDGHHLRLPGLNATRLNRTQSAVRIQELLDQLEAARRKHGGRGRSPHSGS